MILAIFEKGYPPPSSFAKRIAMLKVQVAVGMYFRGRRVARLKLMYSIRKIFKAEKPCKAAKNIIAHPKSKDALCSSRASPSAAEIYEFPFDFGAAFRTGRGCK